MSLGSTYWLSPDSGICHRVSQAQALGTQQPWEGGGGGQEPVLETVKRLRDQVVAQLRAPGQWFWAGPASADKPVRSALALATWTPGELLWERL